MEARCAYVHRMALPANTLRDIDNVIAVTRAEMESQIGTVESVGVGAAAPPARHYVIRAIEKATCESGSISGSTVVFDVLCVLQAIELVEGNVYRFGVTGVDPSRLVLQLVGTDAARGFPHTQKAPSFAIRVRNSAISVLNPDRDEPGEQRHIVLRFGTFVNELSFSDETEDVVAKRASATHFLRLGALRFLTPISRSASRPPLHF